MHIIYDHKNPRKTVKNIEANKLSLDRETLKNNGVGNSKFAFLHRNIKKHPDTVKLNYARCMKNSQNYTTKDIMNQEKINLKMKKNTYKTYKVGKSQK